VSTAAEYRRHARQSLAKADAMDPLAPIADLPQDAVLTWQEIATQFGTTRRVALRAGDRWRTTHRVDAFTSDELIDYLADYGRDILMAVAWGTVALPQDAPDNARLDGSGEEISTEPAVGGAMS